MMKYAFRLFIAISCLTGYNSCKPTSEKADTDQQESPKILTPTFGLIIPTKTIRSKEGFQISNVDKSVLNEAINSGANYLMNQINSNGYFKYRVNPNTKPAPMYNMLRHSGAIYSLMMFNEIRDENKSCEVASSAIDFLKKSSLGPVDNLKNMLGVWSFPDIIPSVNKPQLKLGGSGLGLIAMTALKRCQPASTKLETLQQVGNFICFLQKEDGSFYSKYFPAPKGRDDSWTSLYYPGEAALGLCLLYEIDGNEKWLKAALSAMNNLYEIRKGKRVVEADHWALITTGRLLNLIRNVDTSLVYFEDILINHAVQICESMLISSYRFNEDSEYAGCMTIDGRTTPTATRLEGLITAFTYIPAENSVLRTSMFEVIEDGIGFLLRAQEKEGKYYGGMPRTFISKSNIPGTVKQTDKRNAEIRIDYVQHALSAMILYDQVFLFEQP